MSWEKEERRAGLKQPDPDKDGLTKALADTITAKDHFAQDAGGKLYHYRDGAYRQHGERTIRQQVKAELEELKLSKKWSTNRANEVVEYIRVDAPELWDRPPMNRLNVQNGILDLDTGTLMEKTPKFFSTVQLPVMYIPEAECPAWDRFVAQTFPEDAQELAFEIIAWLMVADTSIQKAILLTGEGANGKSTFLAAVETFLGRRNTANLSLQKIETDRFAAARLVGKLANICPDLPSQHLASTSTFKALTGGDPIVAEYKYRDSFDVTPFARLVFSANHPPRSGDASHAFYRRWIVVPFDKTFEPHEQRSRAELDAELADPRELSGVLNRALVTLAGLKKRGFTESERMQEAHAEFRQTTDPFSVWLDRNTVDHPDAMVAQDELRRAYNKFCDETGKPGMTQQAFGRALKRARPDIQKAQRTWNGQPNTRVYVGIGFRKDDPEPDPDNEYPGSQHDQRDQRVSANCFVQEDRKNIKTSSLNRVEPVEPVEPDNGHYHDLVEHRMRELEEEGI